MIEIKEFNTQNLNITSDRSTGHVDVLNTLTNKITKINAKQIDAAVLYAMSDEQVLQLHSLMKIEIEARQLNKKENNEN